ncbi:hypothetical protein [Massilia sp. DWR3-1-1]|uniref:hypothetical protein n=1 Tax=Massilia sp. DWR3-1-1 TaxID=2804559 RepID=UPI003CF0E2D1
MNPIIDPARADPARFMKAAARLEQPLGALAETMQEVERIATQIGHSTYMHQVVAERARHHRLRTLTQPSAVLADSLATPGCVHEMLQLLAPSLVFPAATPMQVDFSGEALHRTRRLAELHKENLRKMIAMEARRLQLDSEPADEGKCSVSADEPSLASQLDEMAPRRET